MVKAVAILVPALGVAAVERKSHPNAIGWLFGDSIVR